jgi:hypothetical protein
LTGEVTNPGTCQVRSETDRPCHRPAGVKIWGIHFCEPCAREQEAYFAIGELTQGPSSDRKLAEVLDRMQQEFDERMAGTESAKLREYAKTPA